MVARIERELSFSQVSYLNEYKRKYERVPTWLMFKFISFSTFVRVIDFAKIKVRDDVCSLYGFKDVGGDFDEKLLIMSLHWLRKVRNICAHNERVYDANASESVNERYFELLPLEYNKDRGRKRLIDAFVYLKYFLDHNDYVGLIGQMKAMAKRLEGEIISESFALIMKDMGILDIEDLSFLLNGKKVSNYLGV